MQVYILALMPIILPPLIVACIHWYNTLVAHLPKSVQATLLSVTQMVVAAVEQSPLSSAEKKDKAANSVNAILKSLGYKVDPTFVDAAIEAAVLALHTSTVVIPPIVLAPVVIPPVGVPVVSTVEVPSPTVQIVK